MEYRRFAISTAHNTLKLTYQRHVRDIHTRRHNIYKLLNGDVFFPITSWPIYIQLIFLNTPLSDPDTFELLLFFYGNGCPPHICIEYLYTSYFFKKDKIPKRYLQIKFICENLLQKSHIWYYFDIHENKYLYLNGQPRNTHNDE